MAEALKRTGNVDLLFTIFERNLMKELRDFLKPFKSYTDAVSGCEAHLSLRYMIKHHILKVATTTAQDHSTIKALKLKIRNNLERRFPISTSVQIACLLEPGMKDSLDMVEQEKIKLLQDAIDLLPEIEVPDLDLSASDPLESTEQLELSEEESNLQKKRRLLEIFEEDRKDAPTNSAHFEVADYLSRKIFSPAELVDPLAFWRKNYREFPRLARLARQYLGISPSSVPVENMFSTTGLLLNNKRSSLAPHRVNYLSFIHDNYKYLV